MGKIVDIQNLQEKISELKKERKKITLAGGTFDILHPGHIEFLEKAKSFGDYLILFLESDEKIKKIKGKDRPINNQEDRAKVLSAIGFVDLVITLPFLDSDQEYINLVNLIQPDIIAVTKEDPLRGKKTEQAKNVGGQLIEALSRKKNYSTSRIINKIKNNI